MNDTTNKNRTNVRVLKGENGVSERLIEMLEGILKLAREGEVSSACIVCFGKERLEIDWTDDDPLILVGALESAKFQLMTSEYENEEENEND